MADMMPTLPRPLVLVVEDEAALATMLRYNLETTCVRRPHPRRAAPSR